MSEVTKAGAPHHFEQRPISTEPFGRFSTGEFNVGNGMTITGEDQNRILIFTLNPEDRDYQTYRSELDFTISREKALTEQINIFLQKSQESELIDIQRGALLARMQLSEEGLDPYQGPKANKLADAQRSLEEHVIQMTQNIMEFAMNDMFHRIVSQKQSLLSQIPVKKIQSLLDKESAIRDEIDNTVHGESWNEQARKKRRDELSLQLTDLRNLRQHIVSLYIQGAFELILPNEERKQLSQKNT